MSIDDARIGLKACMWNGEEVYFKCKMSTRLEKLLIALCNRQGLSLDAISACFDGKAFDGDKTPLDLGMEDGDVIDVVQANGERARRQLVEHPDRGRGSATAARGRRRL